MKEKIRILHIAQAAGGVDRYIRMLFKYMNHDKFENILICSHNYNIKDYDGFADAFEYVDMQRSIGTADIVAMKTVRRLIKKYDPDIIYAHSSKAGAIARIANIGLKNTKGQKIKCIYNSHGWAFNMRCIRSKRFLYTMIEKVAALFCKRIICISQAEKQSALNKRICSESKLHVIVNGIDIDGYEQRKADKVSNISRKSCGIPEKAFVVGMVSRISEQKAPDIFIEMAGLIKKKIPEAYFIIVGDGQDRKKIESYAINHGINLFIAGWSENALDYVEIFDVAVLLSRWEGFGLVLPEYMLVGKPIVASNVDAIPNIITDEENGLLVSVDNADEAYRAVVRLYNDKALCMKLVERGDAIVHERYNVKRVVKETEQLIYDVLEM